MGQSSTPSMSFPQPRNYSILDYGYCKVWKRNDTHKETMQQYDTTIENEEHLQKYKKMWQMRINQEDVVGVYYFTHEATEQFCGSYQKGSILSERIPYRLSQFINIPYEEALLIIKQALNTFKCLHIQYGLFHVRSTMIGVNYQNQIKVWLHTDLSSPDPENGNCASIFQMIDSIIQAVEVNADMPLDYIRFSQFVKVNKDKINPGFDQMLEVLEIYKTMNRIIDSQILPQLDQYLRKAEGWQQASFNSNFLTNMVPFSQAGSSRQVLGRRSSSRSINSVKTQKITTPKAKVNVYTHKEVNNLLQRQRFLTKMLVEDRSSSISRKSQASVSRLALQRSNNFIPRISEQTTRQSPSLLQRQDSNSVRFVDRSPAQAARITFKMTAPSKRTGTPINHLSQQNNQESQKQLQSSIQKLIPPPQSIPSIPQPPRLSFTSQTPSQAPSIYTAPVPFQNISSNRTNRFQSGFHRNSSNSRNNEPNRNVSITFSQPLRTQH